MFSTQKEMVSAACLPRVLLSVRSDAEKARLLPRSLTMENAHTFHYSSGFIQERPTFLPTALETLKAAWGRWKRLEKS